MIETYQLVKQFEEFTAVNQITLQIAAGELLALLGPNGAGKTTTVRMISSILRPTSGWAKVNGFDSVTHPNEVRRSIGMLTEQPGLYERMTGLEYLLFYGRLYNLTDEDILTRGQELFSRFGMPTAVNRRIGDYSKGMRQKAGLIRAMIHNPAVLLLDEPTSAMDPHSAKLVRDAIAALRQGRRAIILCTHNLPEAESLADRIAIIKDGQIVAQGTVPELKQQLLGDPLLELTLDRPLNGDALALLQELADVVPIHQVDAYRLRYRTSTPTETNPTLVRRLHGLGLGLVTLTQVEQSLEDVYLNVVADQPEM